MSDTEKKLKDITLQTIHRHEKTILEKVPNLNPEDHSLLLYLVIGYDLGKGMYFGLTFPLEDSSHIEELRALSTSILNLETMLLEWEFSN